MTKLKQNYTYNFICIIFITQITFAEVKCTHICKEHTKDIHIH